MDQKPFQLGNHSDTGLVRPANEDYLGYFETANGHIFVVCDGMGGHKGGATAAQLTVECIRKFFEYRHYDNIREAMRQSLLYANQQVMTRAQQQPDLQGMGTTCVLLVLRDREAWYAHVGDSRIYRLTGQELKRLTKDHSAVQEMVDQGMISEREAEHHPRKNVLTRAIGTFAELDVSVSPEPLFTRPGDVFLLCTDGLTGMISDSAIRQVLLGNSAAQQKAVRLVELANEAGGSDNVTAQVVQLAPSQTVVPTPPLPKPSVTAVTDTSYTEPAVPRTRKPKKPSIDIALIVLGVLAAVVVALLIAGRNYLSDDVVQTTEALTGQPHTVAMKEKLPDAPPAANDDNDADTDQPPAKKVSAPAKTSTPAPPEKKPTVKKTATPSSAAKPVSGGTRIAHTVKSGDTFSGIARRYNVTIASLQSWNPSMKPESLKTDSELSVRVQAVHTVSKGDILSVVSKKYGVDKELIMRANDKTADRATRGEKLVIPFADRK